MSLLLCGIRIDQRQKHQRIPAYNGTSVELRDTGDDYLEVRDIEYNAEVTDNSAPQKETNNEEYEMRYLEILAGIQ